MEITAFAPPAEAHARIAYALTEVRKYLIPDSNDEIRQEQMREMEIMTGVHPVNPAAAAATADGISMAAVNGAVALQAAAAACGQPKNPMQPNAAVLAATPASQFAALASAMQQQPLRQAATGKKGGFFCKLSNMLAILPP